MTTQNTPENGADEVEVRPDTPPPESGGPAESVEDFEAEDPDEEAAVDEEDV
ncbi:MAG TPA: hypothetical protein VFK41_03715 [Nocardioidaceae bacterium]|nr:hypothetical protein [Nocardioidaceae bacterium]